MPATTTAPTLSLVAYADADWIVNSRHTADETALRTLASIAGFTPTIRHRIDSLELVEDLILAGLGVALMPLDQAMPDGITSQGTDPSIRLRAYAVSRRGRDRWPPLRAVLEGLERKGQADG